MDQHTRKVINPDQSEIPILNSFSAKQGAKKPNPTAPQKTNKKKGAAVDTLLSLYDLVS